MLRAWCILFVMLLSGLVAAQPASPASPPAPGALPRAVHPIVITDAVAYESNGDSFPSGEPGRPVRLPDDWAQTRPRYDGSVWYRARFDAPFTTPPDKLLAMYVERVCMNMDVWLNGQRVFSGGKMKEPMTRNCYRPQLVTLPAGMLKATGNVVDIRVRGFSLQRVASRARAAGLSALTIAPQVDLYGVYGRQRFWGTTAVQLGAAALLLMGTVLLLLHAAGRQEAYLLSGGLLMIGWALLSVRVWATELPLHNGTVEFLVCSGFAVLAGLAVHFLLGHAGLRSRVVESALWVQCLLMPLGLLLAGPTSLYGTSTLWVTLLVLEVCAAIAVHLWRVRRMRGHGFRSMLVLLVLAAGVLLEEVAVQNGLLALPAAPVAALAIPLLMVAISLRLLLTFGRELSMAEASRFSLEERVKRVTDEIEQNFAQMSQLRVEQVTEKERKRIAADLHDDLGAKLLTIVHTSESERISTLAREALEEMRLSVRGLTGKPVRLADALADWRAEIVSRLGQAGIESDWRGPAEDTEHQLPARAYVQTTRILREAVSNIIKHSEASHCAVQATVDEHEFGVTVQDNGRGIPMELDGKLDRGHGMSSMKHRAKQMQGQCLVESGPGFGTVIRLTLPL